MRQDSRLSHFVTLNRKLISRLAVRKIAAAGILEPGRAARVLEAGIGVRSRNRCEPNAHVSQRAVVRRLSERNLERQILVAARNGKRHRVARLVRRDQVRERVVGVDRRIVDGRNRVTDLQASRCRGAGRINVRDLCSGYNSLGRLKTVTAVAAIAAPVERLLRTLRLYLLGLLLLRLLPLRLLLLRIVLWALLVESLKRLYILGHARAHRLTREEPGDTTSP